MSQVLHSRVLRISLLNGCKYRDKIRFFTKDVGKKCYFRSMVGKDVGGVE